MRVSSKIKTAPVLYPITLQELKDAAKITANDEDSILLSFIATATDVLQRYTGRYFLNHTITVFRDTLFDDMEQDEWIREGVTVGKRSFFDRQSYGFNLPHPPVVSVTHIKTYNLSNAASTFDPSNYTLDATLGRIWLNDGKSWPSDVRPRQGVEIEYVAGYGATAADVPAAIKEAIKMYALQMYECRGGCDMSTGCKALATPYKLYDMLGWY